MREETVDEEGVDGDQDDGECTGDEEGIDDGDALMHGVGVLEGFVFEGEVLVEWFDGVEDVKANDADTGRYVIR